MLGDAMILIQIDTLSLHELQCIAEQEGVKDYDNLNREELIDELREIYEEDSDSLDPQSQSESVSKRFVAGLTDYRGVESDVTSLPGVEALPSIYPETSIHLLSKNATWVYCYWSVSSFDHEEILEKYGSYELILNVSVSVDGAEGEEYDILVGPEDMEWNINVPHRKGSCKVTLVAQVEDGRRFNLASSEEVPLVYCYWLDHAEEAKGKEYLIRRYLSVLSNRESEIAICHTVHEIVEKIKEVEELV